MGNTSPNDLPPADEQGQSSSTGNESNTLPQTNSATVVVLGFPQEELVGETDVTVTWPDQATTQDIKIYMQNGKSVPNSPFVSAQDVATGTDDDGSNARTGGSGGKPPAIFPGNFPGSNGDSIRPDEVSDAFSLDLIGGLQEQKEYLQRAVILPLVKENVLKEWGVRAPKGVLLHGPPGTGKTFMAKALVNKLNTEMNRSVKFFYRKGGDVFSMWFGESQKKLRQLFETAKAMAPSIIFFDELDGLCPSRDGSHNHGTEAYSSVVTCFLGQMDALENTKVFVIAATNRLDAVDPAVRRPGRFDKHLAFGFPDEAARRKIFQIHTNKWAKADQPDPALIDRLSQKTMGFSGADIEKLCKDAVYSAIEANNGAITDDMRVLESHWHHALSSMQRTGVNNFGSYLYMPTKPNATIGKLIQPLLEQVIGKVTPMVKSHTMDASMFHWLHKSFLIYISQQQSKSFLNNHILQGILADPLFNSMSLFELSPAIVSNKIMNGAKPSILAVVYDVINQAQEAQTTQNYSVVIIPNINELLDLAHANNVPRTTVVKALAKIRGSKMFLLATSSVPLEDIKEVKITELFSTRYMPAANPQEGQLYEFYKFVLAEKKQTHPRKAVMLDEIAAEAAKYSNSDNHEHILNLASTLAEVNVELLQDKNQLQRVFAQYVTSKY